MDQKIVVRTGKDRLRYSILFEGLLLAILAPLGAYVLDRPMVEIGALSVILSTKAMLLSLIYNWLYDQWDVRRGRVPTARSFFGRVLHAAGFEVSLVLTSLPLVMWWLQLSLIQAIAMDLIVTALVFAYTFVFSWTYDQVFPVRQPPAEFAPA